MAPITLRQTVSALPGLNLGGGMSLGILAGLPFDNPVLEAQPRAGLERFDNIETRFGWEAIGLEQNSDSVRLQVRDSAGKVFSITAEYFVGCDGGKSAVRHLLDIKLEGFTLSEPWFLSQL
jgi:3-(3-hydroxy-phenyl)propionate hydroxylase